MVCWRWVGAVREPPVLKCVSALIFELVGSGMSKRVLLVSSTRDRDFERLSDEEQFENKPYSVYAILHYLKLRGWQTRRTGWRTSFRIKELARLIDEFRPNVIYTYGTALSLNPILCRRYLCSWKDFRIVHGWDDVYGDIGEEIAWLPGRAIYNVLERLIVTRSDGVVTLSRYLQQRGRRWGVESHFIPNGADIPVFDRSQCDIRLEGDFKLVYTGAQSRWKQTEDLCRAMRLLPSGIKLYLTGPRERYLKKYASNNCFFLGYLSKNDQLSVMDQADVLVVTANQDCNAKLQEYLRFRKPILAYDGIPNMFFKNRHTALLTRDYASAIRELYRNPALRSRLAESAAREIRVHTWAEIAEQFDEYFSSLL